MGTISNILNGNSGLSARQKLLILLDFYNQFVNSDGSYNLQSFSSKKTLEFKGATDGFSKIEFIPTDGGPGIINIYNSAGVIKTTISGLTGITSTNFRVPGATAAHFFKGNGTLDNTAYQTALVNGLADVLGINPSTGNIPLKSPNGLNSMGVIDSAVGGAFNDGAGNTGSYGSDAIKTYIGHSNRVDITSPINTVTGENTIQSPNTAVSVLIRNDIAQLFFKDLISGHIGYAIADDNQTEIFHTVKISLNSANIEVSQAPTTANGVVNKAYADGLVVGLLDDRGSHNASTNLFPSTGGSGTSGAILKGDLWYISAAGILGGQAVNIGDSVRALVDTPGTTSSNWDILESNIGYVPEAISNKVTTFATLNNNLYPTTQAVANYLSGLTWLTDLIWGAWLNGLTAKTTPIDADYIGLMDSADSNKAKKLSWANLKATLAGYFTSYQIITITSNANPTIAIGTFRETFVDITAQAVAITAITITGTPSNGAKLTIRFKDNGTARAITLGGSFEACGQSLLTTTVISKRSTEGYIYDTTTSKFGCVSHSQEA